MESIKLKQENLSRFSKTVSVPGYDRKNLSPSIVHIGLGNFHRSHQAMYLDVLLEKGIEKMGIFEINLIRDIFPLKDILPEQDYLYTLITKAPDNSVKARIPGPILGYLNASDNKPAAMERIADSATSLVTLTVTEGGYYYDRKTNEADSTNEAVRLDLEHPEEPKTAAAFLAAALSKRYKAGGKPLTIMSCDNIPSNGIVLKNCILFFSREHYPEIIPWLEDNVSFPGSMVDRITPTTTQALINEVEERFGISDRWPVSGEDFQQWILEDKFKTPVPHYEEAGVQIVKDAEPYELMKMRLLNGGHCAMACPSYLLGCRKVDEGIDHPLVKDFIRNHFMEEATPTLSPVPGIDLNLYKDTLISRFSNKNIGDTLLRLTQDGSNRIPNFILKSLSDAVRRGLAHDSFAFALAAWARFMEGKDEQGEEIPVNDANAQEFAEASRKAVSDPGAYLKTLGLKDLSNDQHDGVAHKVKVYLEAIRNRGIKRAMEEYLKQ